MDVPGELIRAEAQAWLYGGHPNGLDRSDRSVNNR